MVCTKTLYNYIDLGLLSIKNADLPMKLRRNTKPNKVKMHKKRLGKSIAERPIDINNRTELGQHFSQVFKTITGDNGSEFAELSTLEVETDTKVYFTHPYSSFEKGTNERHKGLILRFIPKGKRTSNYSSDDIAFIEDSMNTLPRKILNYKTPEELFEIYLYKIYII